MKFIIVTTLLFLVPLLSKAEKITTLTPSMKQKLDKLGGSMDTESMIAMSLLYSDQFNIIMSDRYLIPTYKYNALSVLDPKLDISRSEILSIDRGLMTEHRVGISKYLSTGTGVEIGSTHNKLMDNIDLSVSQSLMNDFFGVTTRRTKRIGELTSESQLNFHKESIEDWMLGVVKFYYQAVNAKLKSEALRENIKSKQRLVRITNVKLRRGTAEQIDLFKAKASLTASEIRYNRMQQVLQEFWNEIALQIELEPEWLNVDPNIIPMKTDVMFEKSLELCKKNQAPETSLEVKALEYQSQAFALDLKNKKLMLLPNLDLILQYRMPIQDRPRDWNIGFRLQYPFFNHGAKASVYSSFANEAKARFRLSSLRTDIKKNWMNLCSKLTFLNNSIKLKKETLDNYTKIMSLEERRYSIGRSSILQIIQTADEKMAASLDFIDSKDELKLVGWQIAKMDNALEGYIKDLENKYKKIGKEL